MAEKHQLKIIETEGEYRIVDLTDTRIVGVTESYDDYNKASKELSIELHNDIKAKKTIGAKVVGYRVFIVLDYGNAGKFSDEETDYLLMIMRQMAVTFKKEVIDANPVHYWASEIPKRELSPLKTKGKSIEEKQNEVLLAPSDDSETKPQIKKRKRRSADNIFIVFSVLFAIIAIVVLFFLIRFIHNIGGFWGIFFFILAALAFIPEALKR